MASASSASIDGSNTQSTAISTVSQPRKTRMRPVSDLHLGLEIEKGLSRDKITPGASSVQPPPSEACLNAHRRRWEGLHPNPRLPMCLWLTAATMPPPTTTMMTTTTTTTMIPRPTKTTTTTTTTTMTWRQRRTKWTYWSPRRHEALTRGGCHSVRRLRSRWFHMSSCQSRLRRHPRSCHMRNRLYNQRWQVCRRS